jgi:hypothetical protein
MVHSYSKKMLESGDKHIKKRFDSIQQLHSYSYDKLQRILECPRFSIVLNFVGRHQIEKVSERWCGGRVPIVGPHVELLFA